MTSSQLEKDPHVVKAAEKKESKSTIRASSPLVLATKLINDEALRNSIKRLLPLADISLEQFCASAAHYLVQKAVPSLHGSLADCAFEELKHCILDGARYGFIIGGPFTHADIIVRNKKPKLEIGMHGIRELAFRSGLIKSMEGAVIYEGDIFKCNLGDDVNPIFHQPDLTRNPEKIVGVYILAIYNNGVKKVQVMGEPEMKALQAEAKGKNSDKSWPYSPWNRFLSQMCLKTLLKRACKQLPFRPNTAHPLNMLDEIIFSEKDDVHPISSSKIEEVKATHPLSFIDEIITDKEKTEKNISGEDNTIDLGTGEILDDDTFEQVE